MFSGEAMNKFLIFAFLIFIPRLAIAHGGEMVYLNFWIIFFIHAIVLCILSFFDWRVASFYAAIVVTSYFTYGYFIATFWMERIIDILFFIVSYIVLLIFPLAATYLFYRKIKINRK